MDKHEVVTWSRYGIFILNRSVEMGEGCIMGVKGRGPIVFETIFLKAFPCFPCIVKILTRDDFF